MLVSHIMDKERKNAMIKKGFIGICRRSWFRIFLAGAMLFSLSGCGGGEDGAGASGGGMQQESQPGQGMAGNGSAEDGSKGDMGISGPVELPEPGETVMSGRWGEDITYTLDSNGILTISGTGKMSKIEGEVYPEDSQIVYLVVEEGVESITGFRESPSLRYVSLPSTMRVVGDSQFSSCKALSVVIMAEGVGELKNDAFSGCSSLTSVVLPSTVYRLGMRAFGSTGLTEVVLPETMRYIDTAFANTPLETIKWPRGVDTIYSASFYLCEELDSISLPKDVASIRESAFWGCSSLKDIYYEGTEEDFKKIEIGDRNDDFLNATVHYNEY